MPETVIIPLLTQPFVFHLSGELCQIICPTGSCTL